MSESDRRSKNKKMIQKYKKKENRQMKKIILLLIAVFMLVACSSTQTPTDTENTETAQTEETFESELLSDNTIIIATSPDYPPYESIDSETGELIGFEIDLMNAIVEQLDGYTIEWRQMEFDTIVSAVQLKQVDLGVSGFSYDPEKQVLFSDIYYNAGQTVLVKADSGIHTAEDLNGKLIAAQIGTTCVELAQSIEGAEVVTATDAKVLVEALKTGAYDGVCLDTSVAINYVNSDDSLAVLDEELASDSYGLITSTDNDLLIAKINELLEEYMSTDAYQELLTKWGM